MLRKVEKIAPMLEDPPDEYSGYVAADPLVPENILVFKSYKLTLDSVDYHGRYVLAICIRPAASVVLDGQIFDLQAGDAVLIFPHQYHRYTNVESTDILWLFITFEIHHPGVLELLKNCPVRIPPEAWIQIDQLLEFYLTDKKKTELGLSELLYRTALVLNELVRSRDEIVLGHKDEHDTHRELLKGIGQFVNAHLDRPLRVSEIASEFAISESHLRRIFRLAVGVGLGTYIRQSRIHRATGLMDHTDMNFTQIAEQCGYESLYAFSRSFKSAMGQSPSAYRRYLRSRKLQPLNDAHQRSLK